MFANGGKLVEPTVIMKVVDRNGKVLEDHSGARESTQVVDEASAWTLTSVLEEVISRGTGGNAYIGRPSAGKTGTTDDEHDAWFVGYTPDLSTAVWIGDDASTNAGYTGGTIPAAIWRDYMYEAESGYTVKNFEIPASVRSSMEKQGSRGRSRKRKRRKRRKGRSGENEKALKDKVKSAGNKLLDRISGRSAEKSGENSNGKKIN